nr:4Fe-4S binding protein [Thiohalobacter sp.]
MTHRRLLGFPALLLWLVSTLATAAHIEAPPLEILVRDYFPGARDITAFDGHPPVATVLGPRGVLGFVFYTDEVVPIPAYSGKPIRTLVAIDTEGTIRGVRIIAHQEPILLAGVTDADLERFIAQYPGINVRQRIKIGGAPREGYATLDAISGATITMMVLNASITRSLQEVAHARGLPMSETDAGSKDGTALGRPLWQHLWLQRYPEIVVLGVALVLLTVILMLQDLMVRMPRQLAWLRNGFLLFTVVFIGWYGLAQLSIVNVFTFLDALVHDFSWETFLLDPLVFLLWGYVAVSLLLWGRGVYCGWLCPFGALQELLNKLARRLGVRQFELPQMLHERLLALKYVILLGLLGLFLQGMASVAPFLEVEPFKTTIALRFQREWPQVLYALALLAIALVNRKFFCRYLCPLGAALTYPGRFRIFDWLRRRRECGHPCQICARECEVRAIAPTGEINANECHYCLDCQVTYWNDHKCPPLVERRRRRERHSNLRRAAEQEAARDGEPGAVDLHQGNDRGKV